MPYTTDNARPSLETIAQEAQRALKERPSFSIRSRLSLGFLLCLVLSLGVTVVSFIIVSQIKNKLYFMEAADNYTFEIQQARRFEKNYFLYRTNLDDALEHVKNARKILKTEANYVGKKKFETMAGHLELYEKLLMKLAQLDRGMKESVSPKGHEIERELREHGALMVSAAQEIVAKERKSVNSMLATSQRIPIAFLFFLILLMGYLAFFIARQMLAPLNRMMEATRRIADGDFTPIMPVRKYHDEFSELGMAMNHMMYQLLHRQDLMVQAHKLKAVGTLTAGVAHELNNPINNIILTASMLMEEYKELSEEECMEMINDLVTQSERAQKIVRQLLDFARESEVEVEKLKIDKLIEETLQLASNQIRLAKVKVNGELEDNLPPIHGDRQQLIQVFLNLVLNALDAMPEGGTLTISVNNTKDRDFIAVELTDTGVGIPEQSLSSIFDPFFTSKKEAKGTGLGLSVSLGIINKHGGDIRVNSQVNKGTTFTVLLPVAKVPVDIQDIH